MDKENEKTWIFSCQNGIRSTVSESLTALWAGWSSFRYDRAIVWVSAVLMAIFALGAIFK